MNNAYMQQVKDYREQGLSMQEAIQRAHEVQAFGDKQQTSEYFEIYRKLRERGMPDSIETIVKAHELMIFGKGLKEFT